MWPLSAKTLAFSAFLASSLLIVFIIAVLGCGSGYVMSPTMNHAQAEVCTQVFVNTFFVSQEDSGITFLLTLFAVAGLIAPAALLSVPDLCNVSKGLVSRRVVAQSKKSMKLYDIILLAFSAGILKPKVY